MIKHALPTTLVCVACLCNLCDTLRKSSCVPFSRAYHMNNLKPSCETMMYANLPKLTEKLVSLCPNLQFLLALMHFCPELNLPPNSAFKCTLWQTLYQVEAVVPGSISLLDHSSSLSTLCPAPTNLLMRGSATERGEEPTDTRKNLGYNGVC